ncbi:hypothetical protein WS86_24565 [Burkholderia savannae]|uniref:DUF3693 domain-containing protein n=1 Tax=Burkholderia savannae TaxID=1637837 RepID=UPI00076CE507|nr:DUF3693 domain-containing protein [Burkholderia savannae]AOJ83804.1 hypothetical protein WS86_24565 [Burkholderia savannae]
MKTTVEYLDAIKSRLNLPSDYAIAKALGLTRAAVSKQRLGHSVFDDTTALRVAEILDVDPMEVIAAANAERARDEATRRLWERAWGKVTGATVAVALTMGAGLSAAPSVAESATTARFMHEFTLCQITEAS